MSLCDSVGQVPDLPSEAPTARWQVGDLPHGGSCRFPIDSEMPGNLRRSETRLFSTRFCADHIVSKPARRHECRSGTQERSACATESPTL